MSEKPKAKVNTPCAEYDLMKKHWEKIIDLKGGTYSMREARTRWLPQENAESDKNYNNRLKRSFLLNIYDDTVKQIVGKPFSKVIGIEEEDKLDEQCKLISESTTLDGMDITDFGAEIFEACIDFGLTHILVEYPRLNDKVSLGKQRDNKIHPYFVHIKPSQLIDWRTSENGRSLNRIRIIEVVKEQAGEWGENVIEQIRVIEPGRHTIYRKDGDKENWIQYDQYKTTFTDGIPLTTVYFNKKSFMIGKPALDDLAWTNIEHWQSASQQRNILNFSRMGLLFAKGFSADDISKIVIAPNRMISTSNDAADFKVVEHSGQGIEMGANDLQDLEEKMRIQGLQPFITKPASTATGMAIGESRSKTLIQSWIRLIEIAICQAYEYAVKWVNKKLPEDFEIKIFDDFGMTMRGIQDIDALIKMRQNGEISRETFLRELRRRGMLDYNFDVDEEIERVEAEGMRALPNLSTYNKSDDDDDDNDDDDNNNTSGDTSGDE